MTMPLFHSVVSCTACDPANDRSLRRDDRVNLPQPGFIGVDYRSSRVLFIGQNPGESTNPDVVRSDLELTDALRNLCGEPTAESHEAVLRVLGRHMPGWDLFKRYVLLESVGLSIKDIAYCNVVRCRTKENAIPTKGVTENCESRHLLPWLDFLQPRAVVLLGRWAETQIGDLLNSRGIEYRCLSRQRSLSALARKRQMDEAMDLLRRAKLEFDSNSIITSASSM